MKKIKLLLTIIIMSNLANGQNHSGIVGLYNLGSSSPEGGSHLFILENGDYAIAHFGGLKIGKWKNIGKDIYQLSFNPSESKFELFGRYNKGLEGNTKISFNGFENGETFVQLKKDKEEGYTMQRVFNENANCFSYPYVHTFNTIAKNISFMSIQHADVDTNHSIITINNPERYNDFVAGYVEVSNYESNPLIVIFKDNQLYFEDGRGKSSERTPLEEVGENLEFIKKFIDMELNRDTIYLNPSYNVFGQIDNEDGSQQDINEHHVFNEQKNAFIDTEYYVEGEENNLSEDSYEKMSIVYVYKILKKHSKESAKPKINESPLFQVNCD